MVQEKSLPDDLYEGVNLASQECSVSQIVDDLDGYEKASLLNLNVSKLRERFDLSESDMGLIRYRQFCNSIANNFAFLAFLILVINIEERQDFERLRATMSDQFKSHWLLVIIEKLRADSFTVENFIHIFNLLDVLERVSGHESVSGNAGVTEMLAEIKRVNSITVDYILALTGRAGVFIVIASDISNL